MEKAVADQVVRQFLSKRRHLTRTEEQEPSWHRIGGWGDSKHDVPSEGKALGLRRPREGQRDHGDCVTMWSFDKEIGLGVKPAFNHPLQQENSKCELKGKETGRKILDFKFCRMEPWRYLVVNVCSSTRKKKKDLKVKQSYSGLHPLHSKTKQNKINKMKTYGMWEATCKSYI